jgi:tight adherence protein B
MRAKLAFLTLVVLVVASLAAAAAAAGAVRLVEAGGAEFPERSFVLSLPQKTRLTEERMTLRENGVLVPDFTLTPVGEGKGPAAGVVLVIDASESMTGAPIRNAMAAARAFAAQRRSSQRLAVLAYNANTETVLPFTTDQSRIEGALENTPKIAYFTRMYEAIDHAITMIKDEHLSPGSIVLLSDGQEVGSLASPADAIAKARAAHIRVFSVGLRSRYYDAKTLGKLATQTGGRYREASSPQALKAIFSELGSELASEYILRYESTADVGQKVRIAIRIKGMPGLLVSGYSTPEVAADAADPYRSSVGARIFRSGLTTLVVILLVAALIGFAVLTLARPQRRTLRARMAEFVSVRAASSEAQAPGGRITSRVLVGAERSLEGTKWWGRFKETVELAEISMPPVQIAVWTLAGTIFVSWLFVVITGWLLLALAGLAVPWTVRSLIYRKLERKRKLFGEQLPDNLQVLASALRAGHSFVGALSVVVDDADEPSKGEFRRVVADEQLGVPLEDAIRSIVTRMDNEDLEQVALVAALQRRTGGNMAEVLERVTETIRERFELRRLVQTLTAQGRMSRWIVTALPVGLLLALSFINPEYIEPLFTTSVGRVALTVAAAMLIAGSLVIKRIVDIKV